MGPMKMKPLIIYIEENEVGLNEDPLRSGFAYFLRSHYNCEVVVLDNDIDILDNLEKIREFTECGILILVIAAQKEGTERHKEVITAVRNNLSSELPIVIIPEGFGDERFSGTPGDNNVFAYSCKDDKLHQLIEKLVADFNPKPANFPPLESYDKQLPEGIFPIPPGPYGQEISRIMAMDDKERAELGAQLHIALGYVLVNGKFKRPGIPFGDDIYGFAIDPVTLEYLFTTRFGTHSLAADFLAPRIVFIEELGGQVPTEELKGECMRRLMTGLVIPNIEGFITSFLVIARMSFSEKREEYFRRTIAFIKKQGLFIPVTSDGDVF